MTRRSAAAVLLTVWVGALAWMVRRTYWHPEADPLAEAAFTLPPSATYFAVTLGDRQVGYASSTIDTLTDTLRVTEVLSLEVPVLGAVQHTSTRTEATLSRGLRLRGFAAWIRSEGVRLAATGTVEGDSLLLMELETGAASSTQRVALRRPVVLPSLLPLNIAFGGNLEVGRHVTVRVFDPLLLADRDLGLTISAESTFVVADSAALDSATLRFVPVAWDTVHAWKVVPDARMALLETWIDDLGQIVRATSPVGYTMERTAFELAYENFRRDAGPADDPIARRDLAGDVVRQTAIASNVTLDPPPLAVLRVRLGGASLDGGALDGEYQTLAADTLRVDRPPDSALVPHYRLPASGQTFAAFLRSEPLVQTTDPRIRAQARQIVGRTRRPARAAEDLARWVFDNVANRPTAGVPSAVEVLERRRGDCNEHTILFVALARTVGLPARTAAGVVYLRGRFYYHAWPEVYLNGWVPVDPTFGQFPADAAHVRFVVGGLARQVELMPLIGQLTFEIVDTRN